MKKEYGFKVSLLSEDDGGGYLVEVPDLPGCMTDGDSLEEALQKLEDAISLWIKVAEENGRKIPDPKYYESDEPSGKFTVRVPKQLHRELIEAAESQGVSLNQLINYYATKGIHGENASSKEKEVETKIFVIEKSSVAAIDEFEKLQYKRSRASQSMYKNREFLTKFDFDTSFVGGFRK